MTTPQNAMKRIYKYALPLTAERIPLELPVGFKIVHVAWQHGGPAIWAEVDVPAERTVIQIFEIAGTGASVPDNADHIGTVFSESGIFVWHLYQGRST